MTATVTITSNATAFCSVSDFLDRVDPRLVVQLVTRDDAASPITATDLLTNATVAKALADASGDLEAAAAVKERYTPAIIASLTGNAKAKRDRIVTDLAMGYLFELRPDIQPQPGLMARVERSQQWLEMLAQGERIFSIQENAQAGHMDLIEVDPDSQDRLQGLTHVARRLFGKRSNEFGG